MDMSRDQLDGIIRSFAQGARALDHLVVQMNTVTAILDKLETSVKSLEVWFEG